MPPRLQLVTTASTLSNVARLGARWAAVATTAEDGEHVNSPDLWWKLGVSLVLILAGGVFAGCDNAFAILERHADDACQVDPGPHGLGRAQSARAEFGER